MKRMVLTVRGSPKVVEISSQSQNSYMVKVNDKEYQLNVIPVESNILLLELNGKIYDCFVYENKTGYVVFLDGETIEVEQTSFISKSKGVEKKGRIEVKAKMPGRVKRILAKSGDTLRKDMGVMIIEAMKMENEIRSPKDGILKEINVKENMTVEVGTTLFVIE